MMIKVSQEVASGAKNGPPDLVVSLEKTVKTEYCPRQGDLVRLCPDHDADKVMYVLHEMTGDAMSVEVVMEDAEIDSKEDAEEIIKYMVECGFVVLSRFES